MQMGLNTGYSAVSGDRRERRSSSAQRRSPHFFLTTSSHSSQGSSHSPPMPPHHPASYQQAAPPHGYSYYHHHHPGTPVVGGMEYASSAAAPPSTMWHHPHLMPGARYREDQLPNMSSNMAAALYHPRLHPVVPTSGAGPSVVVGPAGSLQIPSNRRFSIASTSSNYMQHPHQRRRISVSKYQNIPPANFLQVPNFHEFDPAGHHVEVPIVDYDKHISRQGVVPTHSKNNNSSNTNNNTNSRRKSDYGGAIPKNNTRPRQSKSFSRESSRSLSPANRRPAPENRNRAPSMERIHTPDPSNIPVPAFEFNSSHLPLRPPSVDNVNKYSSGSGSTSTPESQRIESRQMIRSTTSKKPYSVMGDLHRDSKKDTASKFGGGASTVFSITKPAKLCRHSDGETCKNCTGQGDAASQCSSVNPPPTFTALDKYRPVLKRRRWACSCGAVFSVSVILGVLIMIFITAFILYFEFVLKYRADIRTDKM